MAASHERFFSLYFLSVTPQQDELLQCELKLVFKITILNKHVQMEWHFVDEIADGFILVADGGFAVGIIVDYIGIRIWHRSADKYAVVKPFIRLLSDWFRYMVDVGGITVQY